MSVLLITLNLSFVISRRTEQVLFLQLIGGRVHLLWPPPTFHCVVPGNGNHYNPQLRADNYHNGLLVGTKYPWPYSRVIVRCTWMVIRYVSDTNQHVDWIWEFRGVELMMVSRPQLLDFSSTIRICSRIVHRTTRKLHHWLSHIVRIVTLPACGCGQHYDKLMENAAVSMEVHSVL